MNQFIIEFSHQLSILTQNQLCVNNSGKITHVPCSKTQMLFHQKVITCQSDSNTKTLFRLPCHVICSCQISIATICCINDDLWSWKEEVAEEIVNQVLAYRMPQTTNRLDSLSHIRNKILKLSLCMTLNINDKITQTLCIKWALPISLYCKQNTSIDLNVLKQTRNQNKNDGIL